MIICSLHQTWKWDSIGLSDFEAAHPCSRAAFPGSPDDASTSGGYHGFCQIRQTTWVGSVCGWGHGHSILISFEVGWSRISKSYHKQYKVTGGQPGSTPGAGICTGDEDPSAALSTWSACIIIGTCTTSYLESSATGLSSVTQGQLIWAPYWGAASINSVGRAPWEDRASAECGTCWQSSIYQQDCFHIFELGPWGNLTAPSITARKGGREPSA
jgi:hypothetical protein